MKAKNKIVKHSTKEYNKRYRHHAFLLDFTKKEVEEFDRNGNVKDEQYLLKGKKWWLIGDTYHQIPKPFGRYWFRNLNAGIQTLTCLLGVGIIAGGSYAAWYFLKPKDPNQIDTAEDFKKVIEEINDGTKTFEGETLKFNADLDLTKDEWKPIGNATHQFKGKIDGNNHEVKIKASNVSVTNDEEDTVMGFIGHAGDNCEVKNIKINADFSTCNNITAVGGVFGSINKASGVINIGNVTVSGVINSNKYSGGLIGQAQGVNVVNAKNCEVKAEIKTDGYRAGGLFGSLTQGNEEHFKGTFEDCKYSGTSISVTESGGKKWVGSFAGQCACGLKLKNFSSNGNCEVAKVAPTDTVILLGENRAGNAYAETFAFNCTASVYSKNKPVIGAFSEYCVADLNSTSTTTTKKHYIVDIPEDNFIEVKNLTQYSPISSRSRGIIPASIGNDVIYHGQQFDIAAELGDVTQSFLKNSAGEFLYGTFVA